MLMRGKVSTHVETVVLLGDKRIEGHIKIDVDVEKLDNTGGRYGLPQGMPIPSR